MAGFDPISLAVGASQTGIGLLQGLFGGRKAKKAQKELENLQTPNYQQSGSILDYYNQAQKRYGVGNAYDTSLYKMQNQNIQRGVSQGLDSLRGRGGAVAGVSRLIQGQNDSLLKAGAAAEQQVGQNLSQLGQAARLKTIEGDKAFKYNQLAPFEKKYNLLAMKAGANAKTANDGLQNIFRGLSSFSDANKFNKQNSGDYGGNNQSVFAQQPYY